MPSSGGSRDRSDDGYAPRAPERRSNDRAVSRGDQSRPAAAGRASGPAASSGDSSSDTRRAVPVYSRPRDGRTPVGEAVGRQNPSVRNGNGNNGFYRYDPYYGYGDGYGYGSRYGYNNYFNPWFAGYGFGLGYFYDPWGYSFYSPYDSGYGSSSYGYGRSRYDRYGRTGAVGQLRLKVKPAEGQVYVDGYFVGEVDSFDGLTQRLSIEAGAHRVEIRAPGYEPVSFDVMVSPGETVTYKGEMKRIR